MIKKQLTEEFVDEEKQIYTTTSVYDAMNRIKSSNKALRIVYDRKLKRYFICDADAYIHYEIVVKALEAGYYNMQSWQLDEYCDMTNNNVIHIITTTLNDSDHDIGSDEYDTRYEYPWGKLLVRRDDLFRKSPLYRALGSYLGHYIQYGWEDDYNPSIIQVESLLLTEDDDVLDNVDEYDNVITLENPSYGLEWIRPDGLFQRIPDDELDRDLLLKIGYINCFSDSIKNASIILGELEPTVQQSEALSAYLNMLRDDAMEFINILGHQTSQGYNLFEHDNDYILSRIKQYYTTNKLLA